MVQPSIPTIVRALTAPTGALPVTASLVHVPAASVGRNHALGKLPTEFVPVASRNSITSSPYVFVPPVNLSVPDGV